MEFKLQRVLDRSPKTRWLPLANMICEANKIIAEFPLGAYVAKCPTMTVTDLQKATDTSLVHVVDLDAEAARTPKSGGLTTKNPVVREQIEDL